MSDFDRGFQAGMEMAARVAENYCPSIIRCQKTGEVKHIRMHVEAKWCKAIAIAIRSTQ